MTTSPSPFPTPAPTPDTPSPTALQEVRALRRQFRILVVVLLLPGTIVFCAGSLSAAAPAFFRAPSPDPVPYLSPLARVGWGLLALGLLLAVPVGRILRRRSLRLLTQANVDVLQRSRHPRLAAIAAIWASLLIVGMFAAPAFVPRDVLVGWLTPVDPTVDAGWYSIGVFFGALWASMVIAVLPLLALRLFDRRR